MEALERTAASGQPLPLPHTMRIIKQRLEELLVAVDSAPNSPSKSSDSGMEDVAVEGPLDASADAITKQ